MKKVILLLGALLAVSATTMAAQANGFIGTKVEVANKSNESGWETQDTHWITHGMVKGSNWGDFELGFLVRKDHNDDNDHDGFMSLEFAPRYNKATKWGNIGGQVIIAQETSAPEKKGSDAIKPEITLTYNLTDKSRVFTRVTYETREHTGTEEKNNFFETEVQYKHDVFGGTVMGGVVYQPGVDDTDTQVVRGVSNYVKWWPTAKVFTVLYGEIQEITEVDKDKFNTAKVSLYANTPLPFMDGLVLEGEVNRYADLKVPTGISKYTEDFFMLGLRYAY